MIDNYLLAPDSNKGNRPKSLAELETNLSTPEKETDTGFYFPSSVVSLEGMDVTLSKYDRGFVGTSVEQLKDYRGRNQPAIAQARNIVGSAFTTFAGAVASSAAVAASLPYAALSPDSYTEGNFIDNLIGNKLVSTIQDVEDSVKRNLPVYLTEEEQKQSAESIAGYLSTPNALFHDLGDGLGFMASVFVPGAIASKALRSSGLAQTIIKSRLNKLGGKLDEGISAIPEAQQIITKTNKLVDDIGTIGGITFGRLGESAIEANESYKSIKDTLANLKQLATSGTAEEQLAYSSYKDITDEDIENAASSQRANVFGLNMLMAIPDYLQYGRVFGKFANKNIGNVPENIILMEGKALGSSRARKLANNIWRVGREGLQEQEEEGLQYAFSEAAKSVALDSFLPETKKKVDGYIDAFKDAYAESWTTPEGQKARLLGGILGTGMSAVSTAIQSGAESTERNKRIEAFNLFNNISSANKLKTSKAQVDAQGDITNSRLNTDKPTAEANYTTDKNGNIVFNGEFLRQLNTASEIEDLKAVARTKGDEIEWERLNDLGILSRGYYYNSIGKFQDYVDELSYLSNASKEEIQESYGSEIEDPKQFVQQKIDLVKKSKSLLDSLEGTPAYTKADANGKRVLAMNVISQEINNKHLREINKNISELQTVPKGTREEFVETVESFYEPLNTIELEKIDKLLAKKKQIIAEQEQLAKDYNKFTKAPDKFNKEIEDFQKTKEEETLTESLPADVKQVVQTEQETVKPTQSFEDIVGNISEAEWENFTNTGQTSPTTLTNIANKIASGKGLGTREKAVYTSQSEEIESEVQRIKAAKEATTQSKVKIQEPENSTPAIPLIEVTGFTKTAGSQTVKNGDDVSLTQSKSQQKFFSVTEKLESVADVYAVPVTINDPIYGKGKSLDIFSEEPEQYQNKSNIKIVLIGKNNKPITNVINGTPETGAVEDTDNLTYTSIVAPYLDYDSEGLPKGKSMNLINSLGWSKYTMSPETLEILREDRNVMTEVAKRNNIPISNVTDIQIENFFKEVKAQEAEDLRQDILSGKITKLAITSKSGGIPITTPNYGSVIGRVIPMNDMAKLDKLPILLSTGEKESAIERQHNIKAGTVYTVYKGVPVNLKNRKHTEEEVTSLVNLLEVISQEFQKGNEQPYDKVLYKDKSTVVTIGDYLNNKLYFGAYKNKAKQIFFNFVDGNKFLVLGNDAFTIPIEKISENPGTISDWIRDNKYLNIESKKLDNTEEFVDFNIDNNGKVTNVKKYQSYKHFLLDVSYKTTSPSGDVVTMRAEEEIPLKTNLAPIVSDNNNADIPTNVLDNTPIQFLNTYLTFSTLNTGTEKLPTVIANSSPDSEPEISVTIKSNKETVETRIVSPNYEQVGTFLAQHPEGVLIQGTKATLLVKDRKVTIVENKTNYSNEQITNHIQDIVTSITVLGKKDGTLDYTLVAQTEKKVPDQKTGNIIPVAKEIKESTELTTQLETLKQTLVSANKIVLNSDGTVKEVRQNSGAPSQLYSDLVSILGDKGLALKEYLNIKDDAGEFKAVNSDWENRIMKQFGRKGLSYSIDYDNSNDYVKSVKKDNHVTITFGSNRLRREADFATVKAEYLAKLQDQLKGNVQAEEIIALYNKDINKLRDLKLHLIHEQLIEAQKPKTVVSSVDEVSTTYNIVKDKLPNTKYEILEPLLKQWIDNPNQYENIAMEIYSVSDPKDQSMGKARELLSNFKSNWEEKGSNKQINVPTTDIIDSLNEVKRISEIPLAKDYFGEPLIFMHAGGTGIKQFRKPGGTEYVANDPLTGSAGIYFSRDVNQAGKYSKLEDGKPAENKDIYYTFLKTTNPYYITDPAAQAQYPLKDSVTLTKKDVQELARRGYDSIIWDVEDAPKFEVVVFEPEQVEIITSFKQQTEAISQSALEDAQLVTELRALGHNEDKIKSLIKSYNEAKAAGVTVPVDIFAKSTKKDNRRFSIAKYSTDKINREEATQYVKDVLDETPQFTEDLIDYIADGALSEDGTILLYDQGARGTEYHEVFHRVSLFYLTPKDRTVLYNEVRSSLGDKNISDDDAEEILAENFRQYVSDAKQVAFLPIRILNFFKELVDKLLKLLNLKIEAISTELFKDINAGKFKGKPTLTNTIPSRVYKAIETYNTADNKMLMDSMTALMFENLDTHFTGWTVGDIVSGKLDLGIVYQWMLSAIITEDAFTEGVPNVEQYKNDILKNWPKIIEQHIASLKSVGISGSLDSFSEDEISDEGIDTLKEILIEGNDVAGSDMLEGLTPSIEVSNYSRLSAITKLILASAYKSNTEGEVYINKFGLPEVGDYITLHNILQNELAGLSSFEDIAKKMLEMSSRLPAVKTVLRRLGVDYEASSQAELIYTKPVEEFTLTEIGVIEKFRQQYAKSKNTFRLMVINEDSNIYFIDTNRQLLQDKYKSEILSNLYTSPYMSRDAIGNLVLDKEKIKADIGFKNPNNKASYEDKVKALYRAIGFNYSDAVLDFVILNRREQLGGKDDAAFIYKDLIEVNTPITDIFKSNCANRLFSMIDMVMAKNFNVVELQSISPEGKTIYSITLNNTVNILFNNLNHGKDFGIFGEANSKIVATKIFENYKKGGKVEVNILPGIKSNITRTQGASTIGSSPEDYTAIQINSILSGVYPVIRSSDKKTEYALTLLDNKGKTVKLWDNRTDVLDYLEEALEAEKQYTAEVNTIEALNNIKFSNFSRHEGIISGLGKNRQELSNTLQTLRQQILNSLLEQGIVQGNSQGYTNIGISKEIVGNLLKRKANNNISAQEMQTILDHITYNSLIANIEFTNYTLGDARFYKSAEDIIKRVSGAMGTIENMDDSPFINQWLGKSEANVFRSAIIEDVTMIGSNSEDYKLDGIDDYDDIDETDALGYVTLDYYRQLHLSSGQWDENAETAYTKISRGENLTQEDELYLFKIAKAKYFGYIKKLGNNSLDINIPQYYKYTIAPLVPSIIKNKPILQQVFNTMKSSNVDMLVFRTGSKATSPTRTDGKALSFFGDVIKNGSIPNELIITNHGQFLGIQVRNENKYSNTVTSSTQYRAQLQGNLFEDGQLREEFKDIEQSITQYNNTVEEITNREWTNLLNRLNLIKTDKGYVVKDGDYSPFRDILETATERLANKDIEALKKVFDSDIKVLDLLTNKKRIESILFSMINRGVVRQKTKGDMKVLTSSIGYDTEIRFKNKEGDIKRLEEINSKEVGNYKPISGLSYYRKGENGKTLPAESIMAIPKELISFVNKIGGLDVLNKAIAQGDSAVEKIGLNPKVLYMVGFRIPVQGLNSIEFLKIKEFLPYEANGMVIVAPGLTKKSGADFDNDKLTLYTYDYNNSVNEEDVTEITDTVLKDRLIDSSIAILKHPSNFKSLIAPNSAKLLEDLDLEIQQMSGDEMSGKSLSDVIKLPYIIQKAIEFTSGKAGVGLSALHAKHHVITQIAETTIPLNSNLEELKGETFSLGRTSYIDNPKLLISRINEGIINGNVDVQKNPFIIRLGFNTVTGNTIMLLNRLGLDYKTIFYLTSQPIIKDYIAQVRRKKSELYTHNAKVTKTNLSNKKLVEGVISKYSKESYKNLTARLASFTIHKEDLVYGLKNKNKERTKRFVDIQVASLLEYINLQDPSNLLSSWVDIGKSDTRGTGKNINQALLIENTYNKVTRGISGDKAAETISKTYLKAFNEKVVESASLFNSLFLTAQGNMLVAKKALLENYVAANHRTSHIIKALDTFDNDAIAQILFEVPDASGRQLKHHFASLFQGNSVAKRLVNARAQLDNPLIQALVPMISPIDSAQGYTIDNVRLLVSRLSTEQIDALSEAATELLESPRTSGLMSDLILTTLGQSNFNNSPLTFTSIIPTDYYNSIIYPRIQNYINGHKDTQAFQPYEMMRTFFAANAGQAAVMPVSYGKIVGSDLYVNNKSRESAYPAVYTYQKDSLGRNIFSVWLKSGAETDNSIIFTKTQTKGQGLFLKETYVGDSIIKNIPITSRDVNQNEDDTYAQIIEGEEAPESTEEQEETTTEWAEAGTSRKIYNLLNALGVSVNTVNNITDAEGNVLNIRAIARLMTKSIDIVQGKQREDTLTEEAIHFYVAMIRGTEEYTKLMEGITKLNVYAETVATYGELYNNDETKLKEEAIAKQITKLIIQGNTDSETEANGNWFVKLWNKAWAYIKSIFNKTTTDQFAASAYKILSEDYQVRDFTANSDDMFAQIDEKFTNVNNILNVASIANGKENYKTINNIANTIVDNSFGESGKIDSDISKLEDIIKNVLTIKSEEINGTVVTAKINHPLYAAIEQTVSDLVASFPVDTKLILNSTLYDTKAKRKAVPSILAISPDGKIDIINLDITRFSKDTDTNKSSIYKADKKRASLKLDMTKISLNNIGITNIGQIRSIPIKPVYQYYGKNKLIVNIQVEGTPVVSMEERTGNKSVDSILDALQRKIRILEGRRKKGDIDKLKFADQMTRLTDAMESLQLDKDITNFLSEANYEMSKLHNIPTLSNEELVNAVETLNFYSNINFAEFLKQDKYSANINKFIATVKINLDTIDTEIVNRITKEAAKIGIEDVTKLTREIDYFGGMFRGLAEIDRPKFAALFRHTNFAKQRATKDSEAFIATISKLDKDLPGQGRTKYDFMLRKVPKLDKDGKDIEVYRFVTKRSSEVYSLISKLRTDKDYASLAGMLNNGRLKFNKTKFDSFVDTKTKEWETLYKDDENSKELVSFKVKELYSKYNVSTNSEAWGTAKNFFLEVTDVQQNLSKEYQAMSTEQKAYYDFSIKFMKESGQWLGEDIAGAFMPQVKKGTIERVLDGGLWNIQGLGSMIGDGFTINANNEGVSFVDEITQQEQKQIPVYYTQDLPSEEVSTDVTKIMSVWASMAFKNKHLQEVEAVSQLMLYSMQNEKKLVTDTFGNVVTKDGKPLEVGTTGNDARMYQDYINNIFYNETLTNKDYTTTVKIGKEEATVSLNKTLLTVNKYFTAKALFGNVISGGAAAFGGSLNLLFKSVGGQFFKVKDVTKAVKQLGSMLSDDKTKSLLYYFNITGDTELYRKVQKLSADKASKFFTFDKLFFLQRAPDVSLHYVVLMSMLNSHTLKDGLIVKKQKGEQSIAEIASIDEKGNLKVGDLSDLEFFKFRNKVLEITKTLIGTAAQDDVRRVSQTILGRLFMTFRNWMPRTLYERFGGTKYNYNLEEIEVGRYRVFVDVLRDSFLKSISNFINLYGIVGGYNNNFDSLILDKYNKFLKQNPGTTVSFSKFKDGYVSQYKSAVAELQTIVGVIGLLAAAKSDDDDDSVGAKYMTRITDRLVSELTVFLSPTSFKSIYRAPIPVTGFFEDLGSLAYHFGGENIGQLTGDKDLVEKYRPSKYGMKVTIGAAELEKYFTTVDRNFFSEDTE